jgi:hypothetical protein
VVAVGGDDGVAARDGGLHAQGHRLLPVVEVAEAPDELRLVERVGGEVSTVSGEVESEAARARGSSGVMRCVAVVGLRRRRIAAAMVGWRRQRCPVWTVGKEALPRSSLDWTLEQRGAGCGVVPMEHGGGRGDGMEVWGRFGGWQYIC